MSGKNPLPPCYLLAARSNYGQFISDAHLAGQFVAVVHSVEVLGLNVYFLYFHKFTQNCRDVLKELLVHDGHVAKDKFIKAYVEVNNSHLLSIYVAREDLLACVLCPRWNSNPRTSVF